MEDYDVVVVGAGQGGIYHSYRLNMAGLSVLGVDCGANFGGVWYHNRYPGARVDTDSIGYCFQFSTKLYTRWRWPERFADGETLFRYHNFIADELNVRRLFRFNTWICQAQWLSLQNRWQLTTDHGDQIRCRFLVMCTGALGAPKPLRFPGLDNFKGEMLQTNRWPEGEVSLADRKVGIIGTGSSGVQSITELAHDARHLFVFQRNPHYAIPAQNRPTESGEQDAFADALKAERTNAKETGTSPSDSNMRRRMLASVEPPRRALSYSVQDRLELLERQWEFGGHGMTYVFSDTTTSLASNAIVSEFVKNKIRQRVSDSNIAEKLLPTYPLGTHRLILDLGYHEVFDQDNVTLVDVLEDPIVEVTDTGVRTSGSRYEIDVLIFALGFRAFLGPLQDAGIHNERNQTPKDVWARGPRTLFGLMTPGFPNLFHPVNSGSPSVLGNAMLEHEFAGDWIADCISYMKRRGHSTIEPSEVAADQWMHLSDSYAQRLFPIRRAEDQYMVHVNDDASRIFIPFCAGSDEYRPHVAKATSRGYEGFMFG